MPLLLYKTLIFVEFTQSYEVSAASVAPKDCFLVPISGLIEAMRRSTIFSMHSELMTSGRPAALLKLANDFATDPFASTMGRSHQFAQVTDAGGHPTLGRSHDRSI